jgi:hypothetical protein
VRYYDPSESPPPSGVVDRFVRRFNRTAYALAVAAVYAMASTALGLALVPAWLGMSWLEPAVGHWHTWLRWPVLGLATGAMFFVTGFSLLAVVSAMNFVLPTRLRRFEGGYFSAAALPWYLHNALFYLVRFTFLPFVTLTPIGVWFLRAMGMRMGKRPRIATEKLTDVAMITLGDDVALGGSAQVFCHFGGAGRLVIAPVVIGSRATIGEKATVMGDVEVGEGATVLAQSVLLPGTRVGAGERWGGVPARRISEDEWARYRAETATAGRG